MDSVKVTIQDNILPYLQAINDGDDLTDKANFSIVIGLFAAKMITLDKAAEFAGKSIWNFIDILKEYQIPWGEYTEEDMQMDDLALKKLVGADIAKLLLGLGGGYCMEYKYRDKKETYYEKI